MKTPAISVRPTNKSAYLDLNKALVDALGLTQERIHFSVNVYQGELTFVMHDENTWTGSCFKNARHKARATGRWLYDLLIRHGFDVTKHIYPSKIVSDDNNRYFVLNTEDYEWQEAYRDVLNETIWELDEMYLDYQVLSDAEMRLVNRIEVLYRNPSFVKIRKAYVILANLFKKALQRINHPIPRTRVAKYFKFKEL